MALELITGHAGSAHISAQEDGAIMRSVFGDDPRPFMSTGDHVVQTGKIIFNSDDATWHYEDKYLTIPFKLSPFYQNLPDGSILYSDDTESFSIDTPVFPGGYSVGMVFIATVYMPSEGSLSLEVALGEPLGSSSGIYGQEDPYDVQNMHPQPPSVNGTEIRRIKFYVSIMSGIYNRTLISDLTPCVPPSDAAVDWLTVDKSDQLDPPNTDAVNLITIYDEPRTAITTAAGKKIAAAWKTYNPGTNEITDLPDGVASKLGNVEAHVYVRGNYGESLIRSGYNEGGYFSISGYAYFDAGSAGQQGDIITLSPTGHDYECFAFVVDLPFSYHKGMTPQVLNGSGYAIVGGTGVSSQMGSYFGATSLLLCDTHTVEVPQTGTESALRAVFYIPITSGAGDTPIYTINLFMMADALMHPCSSDEIAEYSSSYPVDTGSE